MKSVIYCKEKLTDEATSHGVCTSTTSSYVHIALTRVIILRVWPVFERCGSTARFKTLNLNQQSSRSQRRQPCAEM